MTQKVDGRRTLVYLSDKIKEKNKIAFKDNPDKLKFRIRGNCYIVMKRMLIDYKKYFGDEKRAKNRQMPYVDSQGYLFTSATLIANFESWCMDTDTANRWLEALEHDEDKMIDFSPFILESKRIRPGISKFKINMKFLKFIAIEEPKASPLPDQPPDKKGLHIDLSKLKRFNQKNHSK
jgi:hypothetical protein